MSVPPSINLKIDSGTTHHIHNIGSMNLPQQPTSNYSPSAQLLVPNVASMVSSATTHIPIPYLPTSATKYHDFNHVAYGSLFYIGQACNHNCTAILKKNL